MFLRDRSKQAESLDSPGRSASAVALDYRFLGYANRVFFASHPFVLVLPRLLGRDRCQHLSLLDVGAGDGAMGKRLIRWASGRGWKWQVTNLDINPMSLALNPKGTNVAGSALELPFTDSCFDIVIASQMTHHLNTEKEIRHHFREAWRVARQGVLLCDLHRNLLLYELVRLGTWLLRFPAPLRQDGLTSVRRGFRLPEWKALAREAGIREAKVWLYFGTRIILQSKKQLEVACSDGCVPVAPSH